MIDKTQLIEEIKQEKDNVKNAHFFLNWLQKQNDQIKLSYLINMKIPHTLFNLSCKYFDSHDIQNICWFTVFQNMGIIKWQRELDSVK